MLPKDTSSMKLLSNRDSAGTTAPQGRKGIMAAALKVMFLSQCASLLPRSRRFLSSNSGKDLAKAIGELNTGSQFVPTNNAEKQSVSGLTHIGSKGEAQMVDISLKEVTTRVAMASCKVVLGREVFQLVSANQMGKGDVLSVAKIAGICGAKQTSNLIPLCHNINLTSVSVDLRLNPLDFSVEIEGEAASSGKAGVEMEAMTAVTIAGLTVYDMCKAASKDIQITDIRLEQKSGGKSGDWSRKKP
ncbi:hypothetical protein M9H77_15923 [Catharanthus roseus]|uniref:Uncharacterized protein n=1 Tax=Catharanthus roseus TaxID=4058 RepID=A0ACC0AYX8_CATRO|nr:hypothetical protein M9H77_15923 [Catharanthus roseus]